MLPPQVFSTRGARPVERVRADALTHYDDAVWSEAVRKAHAIQRITSLPSGTAQRSCAIQNEALKLNVSVATMYRAIKRYDGKISDLLTTPGGVGPRCPRLPPEVRQQIADGVWTLFLTKQRLTVAEVVRRIRQSCLRLGLKPPSRKAIQAYIDGLDQREVAVKRGEMRRAEALTLRPGSYDVQAPMAVWQIDHTEMDVLILSEIDGEVLGRPQLTLIIDVASRMVAGFHISWDPPCARSVAMALLNAVSSKDALLEEYDVLGRWPVFGLPDTLHSDNASEFAKSTAYRRGCENYHINVQSRDLGMKHQGGHIERLIGSMMGRVHFLPGTTFSNPLQRDGYDSKSKAKLRINELRTWFVEQVIDYHNSRHSSLGCTPLQAWDAKCHQQEIVPRLPDDLHQFYLNFLPEKNRTIQRQGVQFLTLEYFGSELSTQVRQGRREVTIRYDPNDLSHVYVQDRDLKWSVLSSRYPDCPAITLWEVEAERRRRKKLGLGAARGSIIVAEVVRRRQNPGPMSPERRLDRRRLERAIDHSPAHSVGEVNSLDVWRRVMGQQP